MRDIDSDSYAQELPDHTKLHIQYHTTPLQLVDLEFLGT